jgi:hypothetical protein
LIKSNSYLPFHWSVLLQVSYLCHITDRKNVFDAHPTTGTPNWDCGITHFHGDLYGDYGVVFFEINWNTNMILTPKKNSWLAASSLIWMAPMYFIGVFLSEWLVLTSQR